MSLNPTDDFLTGVKDRVKQVYKDAISNSELFYKIVHEKVDKKVDYLLSIMLVEQALFKAFNKVFGLKKNSILIQWLPPDYCLLKTLQWLSKEELTQKLLIFIRDTYTELIFYLDKQIFYVKRINFSKDLIRQVLKENHYSDNQVKNVLELELDFNRREELDIVLSLKIIVDHFLTDIKNGMQLFNNMAGKTITEIVIVSTELKKNHIDELIAGDLQLPVQFYDYNIIRDLFSDNLKWPEHISAEELFVCLSVVEISQSMDLFHLFPNKKISLLSTATSDKSRQARKQISSLKNFLPALAGVLVLSFIAWNLLHFEYNKSTRDLYAVKNKLTTLKQQYIVYEDEAREAEDNEILLNIRETEKKVQEELDQFLQLLIGYKPEALTLEHFSFDRSLLAINISGRSSRIAIINQYLDYLSRKAKMKEMTLDKIDKISENDYAFSLRIKM
ncbi:MAG: hypothetical protein PHV30_11980 [Candidatus Margulisbacteria bacterium]|nr:hypothetical protein [Candidatus Margulisiibacteriota bacterium]